MAYYPVNFEAASEEMKECLKIRTNEKIAAANAKVKKLAEKHGQRYIDINKNLKDGQGRLIQNTNKKLYKKSSKNSDIWFWRRFFVYSFIGV